MKRLLFIFALLSSVSFCFAESRVWASPLEIMPGEHGCLRINYQFDEGHTICNYQMKVNLPVGITVEGTNVVFGSCHTTHTGSIVNNVLVVASMNAVLQGTSGVLVEIPVVADNSLTVGTRLEGNLENVKLGQTNETSINSTGITFDVDIVDYIVLDENSLVAPVSSAAANKVKVKRTINANEWSTICLPFAMTEAQVTVAFGNDVQLANFTGYDVEEEGQAVIGIKVNFANVSAMLANHPYLIKVSSPINYDEGFTVDGVVVAPIDEPEINYGTSRKPKAFVGTYKVKTVPDLCLFINGNKFWYSTGNTVMKGFRGYFDFVDVLTDVENSINDSRISFSFDEPTGMSNDNVNLNLNSNSYYDMQGRRVETPGKGLYIRNGKKAVVK